MSACAAPASPPVLVADANPNCHAVVEKVTKWVPTTNPHIKQALSTHQVSVDQTVLKNCKPGEQPRT